MTVVRNNYLARRTRSSKSTRGKASLRDWWLIKCNSGKKTAMSGVVGLEKVSFPQCMVGKRVRFRVEIIK